MKQPLKLKISLQDLPHKCQRTLLMPEDCTMLQLHFIIQGSFGWLNAHLFEFSDAKSRATMRVGIPDDFDDFGGPEKLKAHKVLLRDSFLYENGAKPFWYNYDFGDDWWHKISFLKMTQKEIDAFTRIPNCMDAVGKCPPEDVGGPWGYANFLEVIKNKKHLEHKEISTRYGLEPGEVYAENEVVIEEINQNLEALFNSENWESNEYELF